MKATLGIDIAKSKFDVSLLIGGKYIAKQYENNISGFEKLESFLISKKVKDVHACMEATGIYGNKLANYLYEKDYTVSMVNPARIKSFANSDLTRNKTDESDAKVIANFCKEKQPRVWEPTPEYIQELQALVKRYDSLSDSKRQEENRLESAHDIVKQDIKQSISFLERHIETIEEQIKILIDQNPNFKKQSELLNSIPGVGKVTIAKFLASIDITKFETAKQIAAFVGVSPKQHSSGSSVRGKTTLCKMGNSDLRKAFYMPAIVAMNHNPIIAEFCKRLEDRKKCKMVIVCSAMRKLIHIMYGVLKSRKPFNAEIEKLC